MSANKKPRRKAITKTMRFEVFKRDNFTCQYCGATPPAVVLQVDHIEAVANGGKNDEDNLITSCQPCNLGKGVRSLSVAPKSLADKAKEVSEREEQMLGYQAVLMAQRERLDDDAWTVVRALLGEHVGSINRDKFSSIRQFIQKLGLVPTLECADIASAAVYSSDRRFRYFCGVCWNKVREAQS